MIIGTTGQKAVLDELEITSSFNVCKHVGTVMDVKEITTVLSNY
jgi:hypothetical protein